MILQTLNETIHSYLLLCIFVPFSFEQRLVQTSIFKSYLNTSIYELSQESTVICFFHCKIHSIYMQNYVKIS